MKNLTNIETVLSMSLLDLGLTPQTGSALCVLIFENNEGLLRMASHRKRCTGIPGECGSCGKRPDDCKNVLHKLPKIYAWRVLKKWAKYCADHMPQSKREECPVRQFLMPAMKNLLNALMKKGLPLEYIKAEIPVADWILEFGNPRGFSVVG